MTFERRPDDAVPLLMIRPGHHVRITPVDYITDAHLAAVADRIMRELHYDPHSVAELRISETTIAVDVIDRRNGTHTRRTDTYDTGGGRHANSDG